MTVHELAYVELYVHDRPTAVEYLVSSFGFAEAGHFDGTDRGSTYLRQSEVGLVVTSGPATEGFLAEHGDGIVDIAFVCADVAAVRDAAVAAGSELLGPATVSGIGGLRHTLVPRTGDSGFPDGRAWIGVPSGGSPRPPQRISEIDHFAVCVEAGALDKAADFYCEAFGLKRYHSEYVAVGEQAMDSVVVRDASGTVTFTILAPDATKKPGQVDAFLERNGGAGVQHVAFLVDDIVGSVREFRSRGVAFLSTPDSYYDMLAARVGELSEAVADLRDTHVLADRDEWGYLLQLFSRSPYVRNTLFFELIQRRGAQGFGTANIRALYEAVERDRVAAG